jgi:electron transfer flavoprotein alpha subunit
MRTLIITNAQNSINDSFNANLTHVFGAAKKLANFCDVLIVGNNLTNAATAIAQYSIVSQVLILEDSALTNLLPENMAIQLSSIIKDGNYTHVLVAADSFGKNLLPRIAGILEISQISEIVNIINSNVFEKYIYAGNILATIESLEQIKLLTVRTISFAADDEVITNDMTAPSITENLTNKITRISFNNPIHSGVKFINNHLDTMIDLTSAQVIVSGGRSLGSIEAFDSHIRKLANKLNAGVGATRAAVESGYAHNDCQIGQTGKVVAPNVYIAIGMSGAVQHIAGMKDSNTVIAINNDRTAPIFEHADYGIVGDLFEIVPELINKI